MNEWVGVWAGLGDGCGLRGRGRSQEAATNGKVGSAHGGRGRVLGGVVCEKGRSQEAATNRVGV